jgi:hypothetical protein
MPRPAQDDPQRPLALATRSTRLLGIVSSAFGVVIVIPFGYFNKFHTYRPHFIALGLIVWFIPGVLFLTCSFMLQQKRRRGAVGAMAIGFVQEIFALLLLVGSIVLPPVSAIPILLCVLWAAALVQLLWQLYRSLPLLVGDVERRHGFEISVTSVSSPSEPRTREPQS